jgi:hypothetical protein
VQEALPPAEPETPPAFIPQAPEPPPTPATPYQSPAVATPTWKPSFEPRKYPAMRAMILVLYILAALTAISFVFSIGFVVLMLVRAESMPEDWRADAGTRVVGAITALAATLFSHTILLLLFMGSAESIRVWLDIQQNTQETAFYARLQRESK